MILPAVRQLEQHGNYERALEELNKFDGSFSASIYLEKIRILIILSNYQEAGKLIDELFGQSEHTLDNISEFGALILRSDLLLSMEEISEYEDHSINLDSFVKERKSSLDESVWYGRYLTLKGNFLEKRSKLKEATKLYENSSKLFKNLKFEREFAISLHNLGSVYDSKGDLDKALNYYNKSLAIREKLENELDIVKSLNVIGIVYGKKSNFTRAREYFEKSLEYCERSRSEDFDRLIHYEMSKTYNNLGILHYISGNLIEAETHYNQALGLAKEVQNKQNISKAYVNIGNIQLDRGELEKALLTYNAAVSIIDEIGNVQSKALILNNMGLIYKKKGEFSLALNYYQSSLELKRDFDNKEGIAKSVQNIGALHFQKGELDIAYQSLNQALDTWKQLGNTAEIANCLQFIGLIKVKTGHSKEGMDMLYESLKIRNKLKNPILTSESLFNLILAGLELDLLEEVKQNYDHLIKLKDKTDNKVIKLRATLAEAMILQSSGRLNQKVEAHDLFESVLDEGIVDLEFTVFAMLNLCEFLLIELKGSGEKEVLIEIKAILEKLYDIATEQESHVLLIEILILQSKLTLLEYNIAETERFLDAALEIAEEKGLNQYKLKISYIQNEVQDEVVKFQKLALTLPLNERIEQLEIENYLREVSKIKEFKTDFDSIVNEGLKNLLSINLNFVNLLMTDKQFPEEMKQYVHFLNLTKRDIQISVSNFLSLDRFESQIYEGFPETFDFISMVKSRIKNFEYTEEGSSYTYQTNEFPEQFMINSDRYLVSRIIDNLLHNAVKFSNEGTIPEIIITEQSEMDKIEITITNSCEEIPLEYQKTLFEKYTQFEISPSTKKRGVGLGLNFCKQASEKIDADFQFFSPIPEEESGVLVKLTLKRTT